jgi:hypothetical protein
MSCRQRLEPHGREWIRRGECRFGGLELRSRHVGGIGRRKDARVLYVFASCLSSNNLDVLTFISSRILHRGSNTWQTVESFTQNNTRAQGCREQKRDASLGVAPLRRSELQDLTFRSILRSHTELFSASIRFRFGSEGLTGSSKRAMS